MKREKKKISVHFTIDNIFNQKLDEFIKEKCINKSLLIETLLKKYLENETKKEI